MCTAPADNHDIISLLVKAVTPPSSGDNPLANEEVLLAAHPAHSRALLVGTKLVCGKLQDRASMLPRTDRVVQERRMLTRLATVFSVGLWRTTNWSQIEMA